MRTALRIGALGLALALLAAAPALVEEGRLPAPAPPGDGLAAEPLPPPSCRLDFDTPTGTIIPTAGGCSATAICEVGSNVSCSLSSSSGTCSFQDQDCSLGRAGWVKCGSTQKNCASCGSGGCPSPCTSNNDCSLIACCPSGWGECQANGTCNCIF